MEIEEMVIIRKRRLSDYFTVVVSYIWFVIGCHNIRCEQAAHDYPRFGITKKPHGSKRLFGGSRQLIKQLFAFTYRIKWVLVRVIELGLKKWRVQKIQKHQRNIRIIKKNGGEFVHGVSVLWSYLRSTIVIIDSIYFEICSYKIYEKDNS
jgi:hypothetical protein